MINILFEKLPDTVEVSGKFYKITTDFRDWIAFFDMISDQNLSKKQKFITTLQWFTEEIPSDILQAYDALIDFASCSGIHQKFENPKKLEHTNAPVLSWLYDSIYVLGAFRQVYNIDLIRIEYMHWWEFSALFESLPEDTQIKKRMTYRQININEIKDKEQRKHIVKIKHSVAFPHEGISAEKTGQIFSML